MENSMLSESNITLEVTVENLGTENGSVITPLWIGLHDGSFDTFDVGAPASSGVEFVAEDGITGLAGDLNAEVVETLVAQGLNPDLIPPPEETLTGLFASETGGSTQGVLVPEALLGFGPEEIVSTTIELEGGIEQNRFLNYATMFIPSNDAFVANDDPIEIFDEQGNFVGGEILISGDQVLDAGTEVNTEFPSDIPLTPDTVRVAGEEENGVVAPHPGFLPPGSGGILDFNDGVFADADFTNPDFQVARITINPVINGSADNDFLLGESSLERINGLEGNDSIFGKDGDDTLDGGVGDDFLTGNMDADQFVLRVGDGQDTIFDYQDSIDSFALAEGLKFEQLTITQGIGEAIISVTETNEELAVLINTSVNDITTEDFTNLV